MWVKGWGVSRGKRRGGDWFDANLLVLLFVYPGVGGAMGDSFCQWRNQ